MAVVAAIAQAVTEELNAAGAALPATFLAERAYEPVYDAEELKALRVTVVPRALSIEQVNRAAAANEVQVDVAVQRKLDAPTPAAVDPLLELIEAIVAYLRGRRLAAAPGAAWVRAAIAPLWEPQMLRDARILTAVATVTYRILTP